MGLSSPLSEVRRFFPFSDLEIPSKKGLSGDLLAALVVTFMAVPQGVAYAVIAGLPPSAGLYASTFPAIVGALFRSSRHVVTGPSNAVSLLVGAGLAGLAGLDPLQAGIALAALVGVMQFLAGVLRLGAIVDYISSPVVLGYLTGAGLLIAIGQLPSITHTAGARGNVVNQISTWVTGLAETSWLAVGIAAGTAVVIIALRAIHKSIPAALIAMLLATGASWYFGLHGYGLMLVSDLAPVPAGLPAITVPDYELFLRLLPLAIACMVLSLVESSAVARAIASRTGQKLDLSVEFAGQGLANIAAGFVGAYPTSGSLARSTVNERAGASSRLAGILAGVAMIGVLLVAGPIVNFTPLASLAGLLVVVAFGLIDMDRIKMTLRSRWGDRLAFVVTLLATWAVPLDIAIYLGVGISIVLFLRRARLLRVRELAVDHNGRLREVDPRDDPAERRRCGAIRILHLEGRLFFGVAGELESALEPFWQPDEVHVLILRLKRTQGMDVTIARRLGALAHRLQGQGCDLILAGVRDDAMDILERTGVADVIGHDNIFSSRRRWFESMRRAVSHACELATEAPCEDCPLTEVVQRVMRQPNALHSDEHDPSSDPGDDDDDMDSCEQPAGCTTRQSTG